MKLEFADRFSGITGSEIRKIFALLAEPGMISLAGGNPSPKSFPAEVVAKITSGLMADIGAAALQYGNTPGIAPLMELIKNSDGDIKEWDDVLILSGSSQGIDFAARTLLNPGDSIVTESPSFLGALQTYMIAQADIHTVDMSEDGVDLNALEDTIKKCSPKFFYIIPTFQNPSGRTTSLEKRRAIYDICKKYGVLILEDDPYRDLRYEGEPLPSIKSFDDCGLVVKLSSYSKTISPGLRVGSVIAHRDIIQKFNLCKQGADVHTSNLSQYIVYKYVSEGYLEPHIRDICEMYKKQRDTMMDAVRSCFPESVKVRRPMGGLFVWAEMPENMDARDIFNKCVERRVAFVPGAPFFAVNPKNNTFRLNFSMPSEEDIVKAINIMGNVIKENM